jgi:2-hydroxy-3-oxopropionate reductase
MLTGSYAPGFRTRLYQKDLRIATEAIEAHGVAAPATALVTELVNELVASGGGDLDCAAVATVVFELSGLEKRQ